MNLTIWHNPRCSKSRATLALLEARGHSPVVRRYLEDPPDASELRAAIAALGQPASALLRWKEARAAGLSPDDSADRLIAAMAATPALIERPLVILGARAVLGRPPEAVLALF